MTNTEDVPYRENTSSKSRDEKAIEGVLATYVETFRSRDMDSWGALFTEDADFIGNEGEWARSRRENTTLHAAIPVTVAEQMPNYSLRVADVSFVKPDIALVHAVWEWPGFVQATSEEPVDRAGIITMVIAKQNGEWLIRASQNTRTR